MVKYDVNWINYGNDRDTQVTQDSFFFGYKIESFWYNVKTLVQTTVPDIYRHK